MRVLAILLALCISGCASLPAGPETGPAGTPPIDDREVRTTPVGTTSGRQPTAAARVDSSLVWNRIASACGIHRDQPITSITEIPSTPDVSQAFPDRYRAFGIERLHRWSNVGGSGGRGSVSVQYTPNATTAAIERVLAHEFGHAVQPIDVRDRLAANGLSGRTLDSRLVMDSITEGMAVFVADEYATRYLDGPTQRAVIANRWSEWTPGTKFVWAPYYFGAQYVHERVDTCTEFDEVYTNPPTTSEQLLHPGGRIARPVPLAVNVSHANWTTSRLDRMGELFVRIVLFGHLPERDAARAAAGWGNDRFVAVWTPAGDRAFVWTLRWDTPRDATEFRRAFAEFQRESSRTYHVTSLDAQTVVVCTGAASVCERLTLTTENETVVIAA